MSKKDKISELREAPTRMTDERTTVYLVEALLALNNPSAENRERAALRLRDVAVAVAGGASPNIAAVRQLLVDLAPAEV